MINVINKRFSKQRYVQQFSGMGDYYLLWKYPTIANKVIKEQSINKQSLSNDADHINTWIMHVDDLFTYGHWKLRYNIDLGRHKKT